MYLKPVSTAGRDEAVPLRALDHREGHPVLHRARGVQFELEPELSAVLRCAATQADKGRVADCLQNRFHELMIYRSALLRVDRLAASEHRHELLDPPCARLCSLGGF